MTEQSAPGMEREAALWFGGAGGAGVGVNRDTPSAAASLRPGPGFRVVTEQPIRGVVRAPGLSSANTAGTHPKNGGGDTKGSPHSGWERVWGVPVG